MNETNEPTKQMSSPQSSGSLSIRLAVFEPAGSKKTHLATITLSKSEDGSWTLQGGGLSNSSVEKLRPLLDRFAESRRALAANTSSPPGTLPKALAGMLTAEGFIVEELPAGDYQLNVQFDLKTGLIIGTHDSMHSLAAPNSELGRKVFDAIASGFGKASDELAKQIDKKVADRDFNGAIKSIKDEADRTLFGLRPTKRLLNSLLTIDVSGLSATDKRLLRDCRLLVAQRLRRFKIAGTEASGILAEDTATLTPEQTATLKTNVALGMLTRGNRETALSIWRDVLKEPSDLDAEGRGWAWRNISLASSADDREARLAAQLSADAFLQAGNKIEAGISLNRLADILLKEEPAEAVKKLDEMIVVLDKEGLTDRHVKGAALHARATQLSKLNQHSDAFRDASEAVELQRGLLGAEAQLVSSLHLASIEANRLGLGDKAGALAAEAEELTEELQIPHFQLAKRVTALGDLFDPKAAEDLLKDAEAANNLEIIASVRILQSTYDPLLADFQRLEILEETERRVAEVHGRRPMLDLVQFALGRQLVVMGQPQRAVEWFKKILSNDPFDVKARNGLLDCLWKLEKWGDAATFLRGQLDLFGEMPGLLYVYGKSLFEAGDFSGAVSALTKSFALAHRDESLQKRVFELREEALRLGGTVTPPRPPQPASGPVTREEFETALCDFSRFISAVKRMTFWIKDHDDYEWVAKPEGRAQDFLHIFLQARFGERVEVFEELKTGAGRLDLYVRLIGGLSIVVELKMAGFRYSGPYAAVGEEQIIHYMENRRTNLGYLVVFDARLDTFGAALLSGSHGSHTVIEEIIDVRPRVKRR
jgi:tetratricopeptide (TPR) repeat protein